MTPFEAMGYFWAVFSVVGMTAAAGYFIYRGVRELYLDVKAGRMAPRGVLHSARGKDWQ